jgi:hypothetical protein
MFRRFSWMFQLIFGELLAVADPEVEVGLALAIDGQVGIETGVGLGLGDVGGVGRIGDQVADDRSLLPR